MRYKKYSVEERFSPYVECIFSWEGQADKELIIESPPAAFTSIVFNCGDLHYISNNKHTNLKVPKHFVSGQAIRNYKLHLKGRISMVGIVFKPTGLFHYLNIPMYELTDERIELEQLIPASKCFSKEMLNTTLQEKVKIIRKFLEFLEDRGHNARCGITEAANKILESKGKIDLKRVLENVYMSRRQFERHFLEQVGVSPKAYSKIRRFGYTCSLLAGKRKVKLSRILYECGYYDQSHFIRDFKYFAGRTPKFYIENNQELAHLIE